MSSTGTTQSFLDGLANDLKITHIVGLGTGVAGFLVGLFLLFQAPAVQPGVAVTTGVVLGLIGGVTGMAVVFLGSNAAVSGAYVNAAASLSGASIVAGPTQAPVPTTVVPGQAAMGTPLTTVSPDQVAQLTSAITALNGAIATLKGQPAPAA